jgi:preprotein translocase subunit YajC
MQEFVAFSVVIVLLLAGYWSLVIFPKQRTFRKHNEQVRAFRAGDEVITFGGIIGTITRIDSDAGVAMVRIAEGVEVKVITVSLTRPYEPEDVSINARIGIEPGVEKQLEHRKG